MSTLDVLSATLRRMAPIDVERIRRLRAAGLTVREIATVMGCSHGRVGQVLAANPPDHYHAQLKASPSGTITVKTTDAVVGGAAVKRALERAGWTVEVEE